MCVELFLWLLKVAFSKQESLANRVAKTGLEESSKIESGLEFRVFRFVFKTGFVYLDF